MSPLSKILEKVIFNQLYGYFTRNRILSSNIHGYRENRSTLTALLQLYDKWVHAASEGKLSGAIFIDLSAAFDLVPPQILIEKLKIYGIKEDFLKWIKSYLSGRRQSVWIDHTFSSYMPCEVGVPQGSILGPLLFLLYINDLPNFLIKSTPILFADDTTVVKSGTDIKDLYRDMNNELYNIGQWC